MKLRDSIKTDADFDEFLHKVLPNVNTNCRELVSNLRRIFDSTNTSDKRKLADMFNYFLKEKRGGKCVSPLSVDYWRALGWDNLDDIRSMISKKQRSRSTRCVEYYVERGVSESEGKQIVSSNQSCSSKRRFEKYTKEEIVEQSVWSRKHWEKLGFSQEEAREKVKSYNGGCAECYKSKDEYERYIKRMSDMKKESYLRNPEEYWGKHVPYSSKEENGFFNDVSSNIYDVKHLNFGVNVSNTEFCEKYGKVYVICDGYMVCDYGTLIFEYDGMYWHNREYDEVRDTSIMEVRTDVIGIIRVSDVFYKENDLEVLLNRIKNGIEKIKSGECKRELIY